MWRTTTKPMKERDMTKTVVGPLERRKIGILDDIQVISRDKI